jgi:sugar transferase (PEP-CTERM/EpsH1 system associated)
VKVLFVCHRVPYPPKRGGKIRPFNIIRHLTQQGHRVTVASIARTQAEADEAAGLREHCEKAIIEVIPDRVAWPRMFAWLPTTRPSSFGYFYSRRLERSIATELASGSYDLAFVHCSSVAPYVAPGPATLKVLDYGDMDSQKWREYVDYKPFPLSTGYWLEATKLEAAERRLAGHFDLCTCTTRAELESLRGLGVTTPTDWFPNGVDSSTFTPAPEYDPNLIVFIGRMDYYPNQQAVTTFCRDILPVLQRQRPQVRFTIVGAEPPASIRDLGRLPNVSVTGSVPDVRPHVTRAALTIAPLAIARGTQNKILESMAMGVPVVCSVEASKGVDAIAGEHLLSATGVSEYVDAIGRILDSPQLRAGLARAGRERVLTNHAWPSSMARLDAMIATAFEQAVRRRGAPKTAHAVC